MIPGFLQPVWPESAAAIQKVYLSLRLPKLCNFQLHTTQTTLGTWIDVPGRKSYITVHQILRGLVGGHTEQLKIFKWVGGILGNRDLSTENVEVFAQLERMHIGMHAGDLNKCDARWCDAMVREVHHRQNLKSLIISFHDPLEDAFLDWTPTFIGKFQNLSHLELNGLIVAPKHLWGKLNLRTLFWLRLGRTQWYVNNLRLRSLLFYFQSRITNI